METLVLRKQSSLTLEYPATNLDDPSWIKVGKLTELGGLLAPVAQIHTDHLTRRNIKGHILSA